MTLNKQLSNIEHFNNIIIGHDPSFPEGKQYFAKMYLWDRANRVSKVIVSFSKVPDTHYWYEGQATADEAVKVVIAKYQRGEVDSVEKMK